MKSWKPSKRAAELIGVMWEAFEAGDRYVKLTQASTARYTGESLVWNAVAEWDTDGVAGRRIRLSSDYLDRNGYGDRDHERYVHETIEGMVWDAAAELGLDYDEAEYIHDEPLLLAA